MHVSTRGGGVKRRPELGVFGVDVGAVVEQHAQHLLQVIDTAL